MANRSVGVLIVAAFAGLALGQEARSGLIVTKFGTFEPSAGRAREEGKGWTLIGVEVYVSRLSHDASSPGESSWLTVSVDNYQKGDLEATPVLLNFLTRSKDWQYTLGTGLAFNQQITGTGVTLDTERKTAFAYHFGVGYRLRSLGFPAVLELRYFGNAYDTLNGFGFCVGLRL